jgi:pyridoxal 4-dehydrogenase
MRRFEGRVAVVSGAAQGMGKAVALRLGEEGATVVAVDINGAGAAATAQTIGRTSLGLSCDIGDEAAVARLFETVAGKFGKLDVLVNVAAIVPFVKWDELTFSEWRRVLRVNLDGLFLMCRAGSDLMRKAQYGRIVANSICPGLIDTEGVQTTPHKDSFEFVEMLQAIKGRGLPKDVVPAVAFLASEEAHWITGQALNVDAGMVRW